MKRDTLYETREGFKRRADNAMMLGFVYGVGFAALVIAFFIALTG